MTSVGNVGSSPSNLIDPFSFLYIFNRLQSKLTVEEWAFLKSEINYNETNLAISHIHLEMFINKNSTENLLPQEGRYNPEKIRSIISSYLSAIFSRLESELPLLEWNILISQINFFESRPVISHIRLEKFIVENSTESVLPQEGRYDPKNIQSILSNYLSAIFYRLQTELSYETWNILKSQINYDVSNLVINYIHLQTFINNNSTKYVPPQEVRYDPENIRSILSSLQVAEKNEV